MKNCIDQIGEMYYPKRAIVNYGSADGSIYFECYDINKAGKLRNARALSSKEAQSLAKTMHSFTGSSTGFLTPQSIFNDDVLYLSTGDMGRAIWYTPAGQRQLLFSDALDIPSGQFQLPGLIWSATANELALFAVRDFHSQKQETILYHAPFFNLYRNGKVCMGNVNKKFPPDCSLEEFRDRWQEYFFNSYFTHLIDGHIPIKDIVSLWQRLERTGSPFPTAKLKPASLTLKDLLP